MENKLAKNFTFFSLINFALPTIVMLIFSSLYIMVDGIFVSRFINTDALSAINIVYPLYSIFFAVAIMLGTGGSAFVAKQMGEQKNNEAKSNFTLIILVSIVISIVISVVCLIFIKPIIYLLGSNESIYHYCFDYIVPILVLSPFCVLQILFQSFFVVAGKPKIGLIVSLIGGGSNIILDYIFIAVMNLGIAGAAYGTIIGFLMQSFFGIYYFSFTRKGTLYFTKPKFSKYVIFKSCHNGLAEMIGNLSVSITTFLFNIVMMRLLGVNGVAAITIILYTEYILISIFYGFSSGVAPVFSYNYGSKNITQLKNVFKISLSFVILCSIFIYCISVPVAHKVIKLFTDSNTAVFNITLNGFYIFAISFFGTGINIFASALFTALSNGKIASIISLLRTLVFLSLAIILLPLVFGVNGVWASIPVAEFLSMIVSVFYFAKLKNLRIQFLK